MRGYGPFWPKAFFTCASFKLLVTPIESLAFLAKSCGG
uniref:Uncharacterized protein n=1 Tax=Nelumbo nucifera TaxID=4432 RepID=A0A822Z012_NELNU|nr:TPA_asm: hypothetical protein HUJ06_007456 [Nelumbo nucifera]